MFETKDVKIDWYSFTVPVAKISSDINLVEYVSSELQQFLGDELYQVMLVNTSGWKLSNGRKPYKQGYANSDLGLFVWFGGQTTCLIELSGTGCETFRRAGLLMALIKQTNSRITRLDIALDLEGDADPEAVVESMGSQRFKSKSIMQSSTGKTCYVGSKSSERYARVYRYDVHPTRAGVTRIEYVTRKKVALALSNYALAYGVAYAAQMCNNVYEFPVTEIENTSERLRYPMEKKNGTSTLHWLIKSVAPAFKRLVQSGVIENPREFLDEYFIPKYEGTLFDREEKPSGKVHKIGVKK